MARCAMNRCYVLDAVRAELGDAAAFPLDGKSDRGTACILTARKVATATGAPWSTSTVARVRRRLQA
jgi:hypothetical protein